MDNLRFVNSRGISICVNFHISFVACCEIFLISYHHHCNWLLRSFLGEGGGIILQAAEVVHCHLSSSKDFYLVALLGFWWCWLFIYRLSRLKGRGTYAQILKYDQFSTSKTKKSGVARKRDDKKVQKVSTRAGKNDGENIS